MLCIFLLVGGIGAIIMLVLTIVEMFSGFSNFHAISMKELRPSLRFYLDDAIGYAVKMVIFIVVGLIGFFGIIGIDHLSYEEVSQTGYWEIASLTDGNTISSKASGILFYINAYLETNETYSFYYKDGDAYKRRTVEAENTTIYEMDDCTPHIVEYTTYTKNKMNIILRAILTFEFEESCQRTYEIYTPTGTILRTYSLDAQ